MSIIAGGAFEFQGVGCWGVGLTELFSGARDLEIKA